MSSVAPWLFLIFFVYLVVWIYCAGWLIYLLVEELKEPEE